MEDPSSQYFQLFDAAKTGKLDLFKRSALNLAKTKGMGVKEVIQKLISEDGGGFLHFSVHGGNLNICKYLLETLKLDVDPKDGTGNTPLHHAVFLGHLDIVTCLLENGANAEASGDHRNDTPLHYAAEKGDTKIITLLLSRGARVDVASRGGTALECAAVKGHRDAVKLLLDHGANPDVVSSQRMYRPLISAIIGKSWECVELLIQAGADPNAVSYGNTPLDAAARAGNVDVVKRLLEAGADPNYKMNLGLTALEVAAAYSNYQSVGVLLPVTSRIPTYPDWSVAGLLRDVHSDANKMRMEVYEKEKFHNAKSKGTEAFQGEQYLMAFHWFEEALAIFPEDAAVLSNMSACFARLGDGTSALDYATKCLRERPEWPKAYYRLGVALNIQKRYGDAADAFNKGLTLEPGNRELKDAYMKAVEARLNSVKGK